MLTKVYEYEVSNINKMLDRSFKSRKKTCIFFFLKTSFSTLVVDVQSDQNKMSMF